MRPHTLLSIISLYLVLLKAFMLYTINVHCGCVFQCKHQLAARLAASLGSYVEVKVSDEELAMLLSKV